MSLAAIPAPFATPPARPGPRLCPMLTHQLIELALLQLLSKGSQ
jgi:hypothetical protein